MKVSAHTSPRSVAGAFAGDVRQHGRAEAYVVGAGALNQAVKGIAIARTLLAEQGVDLVCVPAFTQLQIDGEQRTGIHLVVEVRDGGPDGGDVAAANSDPPAVAGAEPPTPPGD